MWTWGQVRDGRVFGVNRVVKYARVPVLAQRVRKVEPRGAREGGGGPPGMGRGSLHVQLPEHASEFGRAEVR